jgi:hypothetical protein
MSEHAAAHSLPESSALEREALLHAGLLIRLGALVRAVARENDNPLLKMLGLVAGFAK